MIMHFMIPLIMAQIFCSRMKSHYRTNDVLQNVTAKVERAREGNRESERGGQRERERGDRERERGGDREREGRDGLCEKVHLM